MMINYKRCYGVVKDERIHFVEQGLGVSLPDFYIKCVKECDAGVPLKSDFTYYDVSMGQINEDCIGGFLSLQSSSWADLLNLYSNPPEFFPEGLIAFSETGGGDFICFDYRQGKDNSDSPIVYWNHGAEIGKDVSFVASNFEEFIFLLKEPGDLLNN